MSKEKETNGLNRQLDLENNVSVHTFSVSAGLVGVCLTVIGLIKISGHLQKLSTLADEILAWNAVLFLVSCFISYLSLMTRRELTKRTLERIASAIFMIALLLMVVVCSIFVRAFV